MTDVDRGNSSWSEKLQQARKEFDDIQKVIGAWGYHSPEARQLVLYWFRDHARSLLDALEEYRDRGMERDES